MTTSKQEILQAYQFRHACKAFDPTKKISDEDFRFILETGRLSPSSFGFEPWRFVVVQDPELREKIKSVSWGAQGQAPTASHFVIIMARTKGSMMPNSSYLSHMMQDVHHMPDEVVTMIRGFYQEFLQTNFSEDPRLMFEWTCRQSYIALGNMMTAAAQIGIDSCPIEGLDTAKVTDILKEAGVDTEQFGIACMVAFGYRADEPKREKTRQPLDAIVEWK